ncbi:Ankyrin repeat domain-containing protein 13D [Platysternon megacephalum]|uniref:Ankyrin repeat domain-containing protein 13D n=1 Tax=Platysternon megacephalum TaxID=55544 RepID=A0A4D9DPD8_9SAUR|nr:Ankyrin repeat domain-containing protein 13D [Platysternon megacephalum]
MGGRQGTHAWGAPAEGTLDVPVGAISACASIWVRHTRRDYEMQAGAGTGPAEEELGEAARAWPGAENLGFRFPSSSGALWLGSEANGVPGPTPSLPCFMPALAFQKRSYM